jgi:hypothetical protein
MTQMTPERWTQFWDAYQGLDHQKKSIQMLYEEINKANPIILTENSSWRQVFSSSAPSKPSNPSINPPTIKPIKNPLDVPYQLQLDNVSGTGYRECFSSSCAMVAMYYGVIKNDDEYNKVRARYGDSTDSAAQVKTLQSLGLKATFKTTGTTKELERLIDAGQPVPVGWLHHGPASAPEGGGHWTTLIGYTPFSWIHHDPNGEADMIRGGYVNHTRGKTVSYSRTNWEQRWRVNGTGGWYLEIS